MTVQPASPIPAAAPALRLIPTPAWEPAYEDDSDADRPTESRPRSSTSGADAQGTLALTFLLPSGTPAIPTSPRLRLVRGVGDELSDDDFAPRPTPRAELPDPKFWAGRLAQAMLEVDAGVRPVTQLRRWVSDEVYGRLRRRSHRYRFVQGREPGRRAPARVSVRALQVCEPADGVAEVSAVVNDGHRTRAIALRLEGTDGRWVCAALEQG